MCMFYDHIMYFGGKNQNKIAKLVQNNNRGDEWYPEHCGSWKILARSRNRGNFSTKLRRLVFFFLFGSEIA